MAEHRLKTWPEQFQAQKDGSKPFEVRLDDRDYAVNDTLVLQEWDPQKWSATDGAAPYTGRELRRRVTYVLRGGRFGVAPGYVVMGTTPVLNEPQGMGPAATEE